MKAMHTFRHIHFKVTRPWFKKDVLQVFFLSNDLIADEIGQAIVTNDRPLSYFTRCITLYSFFLKTSFTDSKKEQGFFDTGLPMITVGLPP